MRVIKNGNDCVKDLTKLKTCVKFRKKKGIPEVINNAIDEQIVLIRRGILRDGEMLESIEIAEVIIKQYSFQKIADDWYSPSEKLRLTEFK